LPTEVQATPDSCKHRRLAIMAATTAGGDVETAQVVNPEPDSGLPDPGLEDHLSQQLICPISHCIMECPVISPSGHTYDRASILEWLSRHPIDPLSLAPVVPSMLYPNRSLQNEIAEQLERLAAQFTSARPPHWRTLQKPSCVVCAKLWVCNTHNQERVVLRQPG